MTVSDVSTVVRPYGDTTGDGQVQVSFTLPVPGVSPADRALAEGAALQLAGKMGLSPAMVVHTKPIGHSFTFFIVYGRVSHLVDLSTVVVAHREYELLAPAEINRRIRTALGRRLVVVGATIGTDAHTVGIDAILNVKGHAGEKGLEYYREIRVFNMGAQVPIPAVVARAAAERADAVLVSQVVTQRDAHLSSVRELAAALHRAPEFRGPSAPRRPLLVVGGPRFDPSSAAARRPVRWPATWSTRSRPRSGRDRRADGHPSPLCQARRRALRRRAGGRGVCARAVRRRGDRGVRADGRRRGTVRLVLGRAVPRPGGGRRRSGGELRGHGDGAAQPPAVVRSTRRVPGRPLAQPVRRPCAGPPGRRGHRRRNRGGSAGGSAVLTASRPPVAEQYRPYDRPHGHRPAPVGDLASIHRRISCAVIAEFR